MLDASLTILVIETWPPAPLSALESTSLSPASAGAEITTTSTLGSRQGTPAGVDLGLVNMVPESVMWSVELRSAEETWPTVSS